MVADERKINDSVNNSLMLVTDLAPRIGYDKAAQIAHKAIILFFMRGLFSGLCGTPIQTLSIINFSKDKIVIINTIFNACRQISISMGVAISSGLMALGMYFSNLNNVINIPSQVIFNVFAPSFLVIPVVAMVGIAITQSL